MNRENYKSHGNQIKTMKVAILTVIALLAVFGIQPHAASAADSISVTHYTLYQTEDGKVGTSITLQNAGTATAEKFLVEIQPRLGGCFMGLSIVSPQSACNSAYPHNVHRFVSGLAPGETRTVILETPIPAGTYCVVALSTDQCCPPDEICSPVSPFYWGQELGYVEVEGGSQAWCGDGTCSPSETPLSCSQDCMGYCGDGYCQASKGENDQTCSGDCTPTGVSTGNPFALLYSFLYQYWWMVVAVGFVAAGSVAWWRMK